MKQPRFSLQKKRLGSLSLESNLNSDCIIPDILSPKTTRAFWRQNNFNIHMVCKKFIKVPKKFQ
jgi:hypothetical protein